MNYKTRRFSGYTFQFALSVSVLFFSGCAIKPWTEPLEDGELQAATQMVSAIQAEQEFCGKTIAADLSLSVKSAFRQYAVTGFFQFTKPSRYKLVVTNPFDQPVVITVGNQESFKYVNTLSRKYLAGSLRSFGIRNKIPPHILKGNWQEWLTATKTLENQTALEIRGDSDSKGFWITYKNDNGREELDHLLVDSEQQRVTRRLLESKEGKMLAEIRYDNWITLERCHQPLEITIKELAYNTQIKLEFANVSISNKETSDKLPIPHGFSRTHLP